MPQPRKPVWLKRRLPPAGEVGAVRAGLAARGLATICQEGDCPNQGECFGRGVATLLVMGRVCTRACRFCAVAGGRPGPLDPDEPRRVAVQVAELKLKFVVITSVTRDDLPDGGAAHLAATLAALRERCPGVGVELLVPDFGGSARALGTVLAAGPEVLAHNLETVPRLYATARPGAGYRRSLELLERAARAGGTVKSGLMLGLGEGPEEVEAVLADLRAAGVHILTLGQYLSPGPKHLPVESYPTPGEFAAWEKKALNMGFSAVAAAPLVRSSYLAEHYWRMSRSGGASGE
ncbi:MAG: lipoyl synthase [Desulfarculaceae bacterium]|nr:lipoyl synthase [Desulfarculaceae bacterium]MCF8074166.1 lipoyl synthase [Desulfarculaceae bacterium]MCF8102747.1 lipoyl synthase [Desulfarculaceae bacterium]MCF8116398.1 lipoyl synthase [Desulfarculaceae bacterium]